MTVLKLNNDQEFLKRVLRAMEEIDLLDCCSFEDLYDDLVEDLASQLNHIVDIHERFDFEVVSGIHNLTDRKLEAQNKEFLTRLEQYVDGVGRAFNNRGVKLGTLLTKLQPRLAKECEQKRIEEIRKEILESKKSFRGAIQRVGKLSHRRLEEAKQKNLLHLVKYQELFEKLRFLENLDFDKARYLLETKGKII